MKAIYFTLRGSSLSYASSNGEKITMVCFGVTLSMLFFLQHERGGGSRKKKGWQNWREDEEDGGSAMVVVL